MVKPPTKHKQWPIQTKDKPLKNGNKKGKGTMANPRNPLTRRFASFGARLIRFTFIIAAYVIGGNLSASLTRLNRQMTRNDAQLALHPPTDATTQIPNPLPDGTITAHVSSHAGAPAYSASENVLVSPVSLFHQPFVSYISLLIIIFALTYFATRRGWSRIPKLGEYRTMTGRQIGEKIWGFMTTVAFLMGFALLSTILHTALIR